MGTPMDPSTFFQNSKHVQFLKRYLSGLPSFSGSLDTSRMTVVFFIVSGLDLLNDDSLDVTTKEHINQWIYSMQLDNNSEGNKCLQDTPGITPGITPGRYGFRGSNASGKDNKYDFGHITMTYSALVTLIVLGDDLSRVDRLSLQNGMKELQLQNGSFAAVYGSESDMRFVYCAAVICYILQDWSMIDVERSIEFIRTSLSYEGAFGQGPGHEAHGGSTFCAVATLVLMNRLSDVLDEKKIYKLRRWCVMKQASGFQGRPNKEPDTCYSFWVGATLALLQSFHVISAQDNLAFLKTTEDKSVGGFAKYPEVFPDVLHTFLGLSGLSLHEELRQDLKAVEPTLNISKNAMDSFRNKASSHSSRQD